MQKRFVKEYPLDFNGAAAYMRASGTTNKKSAGVQASKFLRIPKIKEAIDAYVHDLLGPQEQELLGNVKFWREIRDGVAPGVGMGKMVPKAEVMEILQRSGADDDTIKEVDQLPDFEVAKGRLSDRLKASEMLARYQQMFVEKHDFNLSGTVQIVDDIK
jgi:hypothetical protein